MPRASLFDTHFSPAEQAKLAAWLDEHPHVTVDAFRNLLAERGLLVARSTAGETKRKIEQLGERLREGRRMMDTLAAGLEGKDDSQSFRALLEMGRNLVFEFQQAALESGGVMEAGDLHRMSRALHDIMKAAHHNQVAGEAGRREAREAALKEAAEAVDKEAKRQGLSPDTAAAIRAVFEGLEEGG